MKTYFSKLHYKKKPNSFDKAVIKALRPFSAGYLKILNIRKWLYEKHVFKTTYLPAYVISVGNLTTGGTGKTPVVAEIAKYITNELGKKTAILSRGYQGMLNSKLANVISDGENIYYDADMAGDEPFWLASNTENVPVLTGKSRVRSGVHAIEEYNSEVIILDDGFQHLKLARNLDIIVIDCINWFGNNELLPIGPLREPIEEISRADKIVLVNKMPMIKEAEEACNNFAELINEKYNKEVFICNMKPFRFYDIIDFNIIDNSRKAYVFTGIGQPEVFFANVELFNIDIVHKKSFADHHNYTEEDIKQLFETAKKNGADCLITTEKDAVKLLPVLSRNKPEIPVFALKLAVEMDFDGLLKEIKDDENISS